MLRVFAGEEMLMERCTLEEAQLSERTGREGARIREAVWLLSPTDILTFCPQWVKTRLYNVRGCSLISIHGYKLQVSSLFMVLRAIYKMVRHR